MSETKIHLKFSRSKTLGIGLGLLVGCAGSSQPTHTAEDEPTAEELLGESSTESTPSSQQDPSTEQPAKTEESAPTEDPAASPATPEDFRQALQVVIQDDALLSQLNLEEPGRFPLKIAGEEIQSDIELTAHTESVEVVSPPENPEEEAVLVFSKIDLNGEKGTFKYKYEIEGVRGTTRVIKTDGRWVLKSSRVSQY